MNSLLGDARSKWVQAKAGRTITQQRAISNVHHVVDEPGFEYESQRLHEVVIAHFGRADHLTSLQNQKCVSVTDQIGGRAKFS
jgi:hypothetical protein